MGKRIQRMKKRNQISKQTLVHQDEISFLSPYLFFRLSISSKSRKTVVIVDENESIEVNKFKLIKEKKNQRTSLLSSSLDHHWRQAIMTVALAATERRTKLKLIYFQISLFSFHFIDRHASYTHRAFRFRQVS